jgi:hypothetical protein
VKKLNIKCLRAKEEEGEVEEDVERAVVARAGVGEVSHGKVKPVLREVFNNSSMKKEVLQLCQLDNHHRHNHSKQRYHPTKLQEAVIHNTEPKLLRNKGKEKDMNRLHLNPSNKLPVPNLSHNSKRRLQPKACLKVNKYKSNC